MKKIIRSPKCRKCGCAMRGGQALVNTLAGIGDFVGDRYATTQSLTGPPVMESVWKCPKCGYSVTKGKEK